MSSSRHTSRERALQALYQVDLAGAEPAAALQAAFATDEAKLDGEGHSFARALVEGWGDRPLEDAPFELVTDVAHHAIAAGDADLTARFALEAARRRLNITPATIYNSIPANVRNGAVPSSPRASSDPAHA